MAARAGTTLALVAGCVALWGCPEPTTPPLPKTSEAASPAPQVSAQEPPPAQARPGRAEAPADLGRIVEAGKIFRPTTSVILWDEAKQELSFHLYPFAPDATELLQVRKGESFIFFSKETPDPRQWPEHCPAATYVLSWSGKPRETVGDLGEARYALHLHGISEKNANMSINKLKVSGTLSGEVAAGETIQLATQDTADSSGEIRWNLNLRGQVLIPPPPPQAPPLRADQRGKLGVLTLGDKVYKVEGALAKRDPREAFVRLALLSRPATPQDAEAFLAGELPLGAPGQAPYAEIYLFLRGEELVAPAEIFQRKLILKNLESPLSTTSCFMDAEGFDLQGALQPGESFSLRAKGLSESSFSSSLGRITSWDLELQDLEVVEVPTK